MGIDMETWVVSLIANAVLGLVAWTMKSTISDLKEQIVLNRTDIDHVKEKYFKKEDFQEFKRELWQRLDRFEQDVKDQVNRNG
jgi:hypothetical protein